MKTFRYTVQIDIKAEKRTEADRKLQQRVACTFSPKVDCFELPPLTGKPFQDRAWKCPHCGVVMQHEISDGAGKRTLGNYAAFSLQADENETATQEYHCRVCDKWFKDTYRLVKIEKIKKED